MIKLIETTTFTDKTKKESKSEKQFATLNSLYKALKASPLSSEMCRSLKMYNKLEITYDDAKTVIEIKNEPTIILTDAK